MDPIKLVAATRGSILTIVRLFGKTVLSVKWWKKYINIKSEDGKSRQRQIQKSKSSMSSYTSNQIIVGSNSQPVMQVKLSKWNNNDLINKKVLSCEMIDIGYICSIENQLMTILGKAGRQEKYIIPTYFVREFDNEKVIIDTSARYLYHYQVNETT